jgi:uncharacterized delta-60 repeat protein
MRAYSWLLERIGSGRRPVRRQAAKSRHAPHWRPRLELLEDRNLLSAGAFDPTFGSGGIANPAGTNLHGSASSMAIYSSAQTATAGDIVAAGYIFPANRVWQMGLVRFTANGQPDTSFGSKGEVMTSFKSYGYSEANAVAIQGDGKILAMGTAYPSTAAGPAPAFVITRYNVNGSLDTTFGSKGMVITNLSGSPSSGSNDYARAGFLQPDGKIVVAGIANTGPNASNNIGLVRYNPNGSLDTSFRGGGKFITSHTVIPGSYVDPAGEVGDTEVGGAALQADGKILVSGYTEVTDSPRTYEAFVLRYNADGTLDTHFGNKGAVTLPAQPLGGPSNGIGEIALEPSGEIVVSGITQIALLQPDGNLDTTFGKNGFAPNVVSSGFLALEPNGDIMIAAINPGLVSRYLPDGKLDSSFGSGGTLNPFPGYDLTSLAIQADGKIDVASGFTIGRLLPAEPQIGSFNANASPDGSVTLTASGVTALNPGSTVTQVSFYVDSNGDGVLDAGDAQLTGTLTQSAGTWTLTFSTTTAGLVPGAYTLFVQAQDSYGALSDPLALTLQVT